MSSRLCRPARKSGGGSLLVGAAVIGGWLALTHPGVSAPAPSGPVTTASQSPNVALGQAMAASDGITGSEWTCLNETWTRESGWSATAANPASDARGIAQDINGWSAGYSYGDAAQQIAWGIAYITARYGTPCGAWDHEEADGWY